MRARAATRFALALLLLPWTWRPLAGRADEVPSWMPLRSGERWEYQIARDHQFAPSRAAIDRVFSDGALVREVIARDGNVFTIRESLRLQPRQRNARPELQRTISRWTASGALLQLDNRSQEQSPAQEVVYKPPLRWLAPTPEAAARWPIGIERWDGAEYALDAEVLGREDVTDTAPRHDDCLKVRYAGPVTGTTPIYSGPIPIRKGRVERIVWYKQGIGIVRERITSEAELEIPPDSSIARVSEVQTRRLVNHRPGQ